MPGTSRTSFRAPSEIYPQSANTGAVMTLSCLPFKHGSPVHYLTKKLVLAVDTENEARVRNHLLEPIAQLASVTELGPIKIINVDPMGSALHLAAHRGYTNIVHMFLDYGVYVDLKSLVDRATPFLRACRKAHMSTMRLLIRRGAGINVKDAYGRTPLHFVCASGNVEAIFMLIDLGADLYTTDNRGYLPTQRATLPHQRRITEFLNFREMNGLGHEIGEEPDRFSADSQRSGIFEAARKAQLQNSDIFDKGTAITRQSLADSSVNVKKENSDSTKLKLSGIW